MKKLIIFFFLFFIFRGISYWAFSISWSQILVSWSETWLNFRTWALSNTVAATALAPNIVEAKYQLRIQNGATFNTSDISLIINHRVEGQANTTTDTWIWKINWWVVIVQWSNTMFAEEWVIQQWENVHVYIQKTGGNQSFIGSNARPTPSSFKNVKFILKSWDIDAHLQATWWTWLIQNVLFKNEWINEWIMALRETDTSDVELYRISPFWWNSAPTTFHKNMKLYNSSNNEINYTYRRNNWWAIFYNVYNTFNNQKMSAIRYVSLWAWGSDWARSVLVWAYKPQLLDIYWNAISWAKFWIYKVSDNTLESYGETWTDWKPKIVNLSTDNAFKSYDNTFVVWWISYNRKIYDSWTKYIKQSITPTTTGWNIVSIDQWNFKIIQRKYDYQTIELTQSFLNDYEWIKVMFPVSNLTKTEIQASNIAWISFNKSTKVVTINQSISIQDIWHYYRYWISQSSNFDSNDSWTFDGTTLNIWDWNIVVTSLSWVINSPNLKIKTTWTISVSNGWIINALYEDSTANSWVKIYTPYNNQIVRVYGSISDLNNNTNSLWTYTSDINGELIYRYNSNISTKRYFKTELSSTIWKWSMKWYVLNAWLDNELDMRTGWDFTYINLQLRQIKGSWFDSNLHSLKWQYSTWWLVLSTVDKSSIAEYVKTKMEEPSWLLSKIYSLLQEIFTRIISIKYDTQKIN